MLSVNGIYLCQPVVNIPVDELSVHWHSVLCSCMIYEDCTASGCVYCFCHLHFLNATFLFLVIVKLFVFYCLFTLGIC